MNLGKVELGGHGGAQKGLGGFPWSMWPAGCTGMGKLCNDGPTAGGAIKGGGGPCRGGGGGIGGGGMGMPGRQPGGGIQPGGGGGKGMVPFGRRTGKDGGKEGIAKGKGGAGGRGSRGVLAGAAAGRQLKEGGWERDISSLGIKAVDCVLVKSSLSSFEA